MYVLLIEFRAFSLDCKSGVANGSEKLLEKYGRLGRRSWRMSVAESSVRGGRVEMGAWTDVLGLFCGGCVVET